MVFLDCGMTVCVFRIYRLLYLKRVNANYTSINLTLKIGIFFTKHKAGAYLVAQW